MGALTLKTARARTGGVVWNDLKAHPVPVAEGGLKFGSHMASG